MLGVIVNIMKKFIGGMLNGLFSLFPIQNNKVLFIGYYGSSYGCNPKYISMFLCSDECPESLDVVWVFNEEKKQIPDSFRVVLNRSIRYFYEIATARFVISNYRLLDDYTKRKDQCYIQTWHSSLRLKQIEKDAESILPSEYVSAAKRDSRKIDLLISGCKASTDIFKRAFWYTGKILECGTPRNDILLEKNQTKTAEIKARLGIALSTQVCLYAPTFRNNEDTSLYQLNYDTLGEALSASFGGQWVFLERFHPHLLNKMDEGVVHQDVQNVTQYDDIQELLYAADFLITDYSSLMFDFGVSNKNCMLYVPDLDDYINKERELYFDVEELPFDVARSESLLALNITEFDENEYKKKLDRFNNQVGSFETGSASKQVGDYVIQEMRNAK